MTEKNFRMSAFQVYFGLLKHRYQILVNIRDHKLTKPLELKRKIFNKFKSNYRRNLQEKRDMTQADIHRTIKIQTICLKGISRYAKEHVKYQELKKKANYYYNL